MGGCRAGGKTCEYKGLNQFLDLVRLTRSLSAPNLRPSAQSLEHVLRESLRTEAFCFRVKR